MKRSLFLLFCVVAAILCFKLYSNHNLTVSQTVSAHVKNPEAEKLNSKATQGIKGAKQEKNLANLLRDNTQALTNKDVIERARQSSEVIAKLCSLGLFDEAFNLLEPSLGHVRTSQLEAFFSSGTLTLAQAAERIKPLRLSLDGITAASAFINSRATPSDLETYLGSPEFQALVPLLQAELPPQLPALNRIRSRFLSEKANQASTPAEAMIYVEIAKLALSQSNLDTDSFIGVVKSAKIEASEKWKTLNDNLTTPSEFDSQLVDKMIAKDGDGAIALLSAKEDSRHLAALEQAIVTWSTLDDSAAQRWYKANKTNLTLLQQDSISKAFSEWAFKMSEFDTASSWAAAINDEQARKLAMEKLRK